MIRVLKESKQVGNISYFVGDIQTLTCREQEIPPPL